MPDRTQKGRRALVTGCAGFIGSHLCDRLVADGWEVTGVDAFTDFYGEREKLRNVEALLLDPRFDLLELDLAADPLSGLTSGMDAVFHLAGQPGARQSFGPGVEAAIRNNVEATGRLLGEAIEDPPRVFVFASSSTVYGIPQALPTPESSPMAPLSPYGQTKVAAEGLVRRFAGAGLPTVTLRYFSCYGPRQRPDMALARFIEAMRSDRPVPVYGDGLQRRDFTYVADVVEATVRAADHARPGADYNVGGGEPVELLTALRTAAEMLGVRPRIELRPPAAGDARETRADCRAARRDLGFAPTTSLAEGLAAQIAGDGHGELPPAASRPLATAGGPA
jgi:UDP-glucuronate 4-epimerase